MCADVLRPRRRGVILTMKRFDSREARRRSGRARSDSFLSNSNRRASHKAAQLCRQAMQALSLALADSSDDLLRELTVICVDPAPDASRLLVTLAQHGADLLEDHRPHQVHEARAHGVAPSPPPPSSSMMASR